MPGEWEWARARRVLASQLTEDTIADVVIRTSLLVAWMAVALLVVTVVAETFHMIRHDGLPMPDVRGLGLTQSLARVIAVGLLVVVPMWTSPSRAIARDASLLDLRAPVETITRADRALIERTSSGHDRPGRAEAAPTGPFGSDGELGADLSGDAVDGSQYVVRSGDSIFAIAERIAGPDSAAIATYAERLVDLNLGRQMADGQRFVNAAYIDVGWVLDLPNAPGAGSSRGVESTPDTVSAGTGTDAVLAHVVDRGESLWSIADDELGDPDRWPEIFEANRGRTFDDGRTLDDPSLIHPGWELDLPVASADPSVPESDTPTDERDQPAEVSDDDDPATVSTTVDPPPDLPDQADDPEPSDPEPSDPEPSDNTTTEPGVTGPPMPGVAPRPSNRWIGAPYPVAAAPAAASTTSSPHDPGETAASEPGVELLTLGRAAMLSAGVLTLVAVRRRRQLRQSMPRARFPEPEPAVAATERTLRSADPGERFVRVDLAIRAATMALVSAGARVVAVAVADDGAVELHTSGSAELDAPWQTMGDTNRWQLPATVPIELLAEPARQVGAPCPTLVQLGRTVDDHDLFVDLEALEALEVGGPGLQAEAIVTALAATLAGSVLAEVSTLIGVGVDDAAFLGHRHHVAARHVRDAFDRAAEAAGSTAVSGRSTFELRARATGGETWEPAVVLIGASAGAVVPPGDRTALAVVSASPIHGPSSRLAPDGDAWVLRPLGVRCVPVGLGPDDLASLADLVGAADTDLVPNEPIEPLPPATRRAVSISDDDDMTLAPLPDEPSSAEAVVPEPDPLPSPPIVVRLLGPVVICSADGRTADFDKSKAKELIAWLATHRERATRSGARTALWELDVRDATFANVVSDARRSMARLVEPPDGEEWIGRTLTESLPLHSLVRTDADLVRDALAAARVQPPEQAIHTLRPAAELVVGVPFEGTGYLWPDAEGIASQLVLLATSVSSELAAHCLSMGDIDGVFDATGRGLQVLPGHELLIGLRMRAHARAGDHAGVRHEWEQYERVVNADPWSDGEPAPDLVQLRRELLAR